MSYMEDDEQVKYFDRTVHVLGSYPNSYGYDYATDTVHLPGSGCVGVTSGGSRRYQFKWDKNTAVQAYTRANMTFGLHQGVGIYGRIGNVIDVKEIHGNITFLAAHTWYNPTPVLGTQNGECAVTLDSNGGQFLRTTYRWCIVKDLKAYAVEDRLSWESVFCGNTADTSQCGVHSEIRPEYESRYEILHDEIVQLTATDPQTTVRFVIPGKDVGMIHYQGESPNTNCSTNIWIIYSALVTGIDQVRQVTTPSVKYNSRMCFTDK
ncbi:MAG: coat protein [Cressdnaviricota sp.]|nr:MAG: coat protein [Cressdnaviricota sp.]